MKYTYLKRNSENKKDAIYDANVFYCISKSL